jgi:hypothetical protein
VFQSLYRGRMIRFETVACSGTHSFWDGDAPYLVRVVVMNGSSLAEPKADSNQQSSHYVFMNANDGVAIDAF